MDYQYAKKFFIGYSDVDQDDRCRLSKIIDLLQNTATLHSKSVGYGTKEMMDKKLAWLMIGWKVKILKYPEADMDVEVRTWSRGVKACTAKRGYEIFDEFGTKLVIADSSWALFDLEKQKLTQAPDEMVQAYSMLEKAPFPEEKTEKIKDKGAIENEIKIVVGKRDIDTNHHMNNAKYMEYIVEVLPENKEIVEFECTYKKQIGYGEEIRISYGDGIARILNENGDTAFLLRVYN